MASKKGTPASTSKSTKGKPATTKRAKVQGAVAVATSLPVCGIIMPISAIDNCSEAHWSDVREIITDAIEAAGFTAQLVSDADDIGIIQKRIIQNVYDNPIIVCDVSGKNPNVMFELGMRLAFDKPIVIVKDDKTSYSFDTAPIEHLQYPRDLRFSQVVDFKASLSDKIRGTYKKATENATYTPFLKHFGSFTIAKLDTKNVSTDDYILEEIRALRNLIVRRESSSELRAPGRSRPFPTLCLRGANVPLTKVGGAVSRVVDTSFHIESVDEDHLHVTFPELKTLPSEKLLRACRSLAESVRILPPR